MGLINLLRSSTGNSGNRGIKPARTVKFIKDSAGTPAVDLVKLEADGHVSLVKTARKAGISLSKRNLAGVRAQAVLVLDHSGSMRGDYHNGKVQALVERILGFALNIDADGVVPVIPFDTVVYPPVNVGVADDHDKGVYAYQDIVNRKIWRRSQMGRTNLTEALMAVRDMARTTDAPIFCVVVTDGAPDSRSSCTEVVIDLARHPAFLKFVSVRDASYPEMLNTLPADRRLVDNVNAKVFSDLGSVTDLQFADDMTEEWGTWIEAAMAAGILQ